MSKLKDDDYRLKPKRKCHDCGTPTYNYRCDKCWEKIREKYKEDFILLDVSYSITQKGCKYREE